jgi:hypothetical protein
VIELDGRVIAAARSLMRPAQAHLETCEVCAQVVHRMSPPENLCRAGRALLGRLSDRFTPDEIWMAYATLDCDECSETEQEASV